MSVVRNREKRNMVLLSTFDLLLTCFCFGFLKFDVCMIGKTTVLVICFCYLFSLPFCIHVLCSTARNVMLRLIKRDDSSKKKTLQNIVMVYMFDNDIRGTLNIKTVCSFKR